MVESHATERSAQADSNLTQTDVDRAKHSTNDAGVPILNIAGVGAVHHPAWVALYALNYAGLETYDAELNLPKNHDKFKASVSWLEENLKRNKDGLWVWLYEFDSTYNDVSIHSPWSSAFAQAVGIQALLASYRIDGNKRALDLAEKAAIPLITSIEKGGLLFRSGVNTWFEEIPTPIKNPSHILNGHMRTLLALKELVDITHDVHLKEYLNSGLDTLYRWLPLYDTGYSLRYDLNPKKTELLFRFANPYGFSNLPLAINKISLVDPKTKEEVAINVGTSEDAAGNKRISGTDWGLAEKIGGRQARRLLSSQLDNNANKVGAPHTYFYLPLPGSIQNNLREEWYELTIEYYDEQPGNIAIQQRTISPGPAFRDMRDGDLHLTGSKQWRKWKVPLRPTDLGYWVGNTYAEKHALYLEAISKWDARFKSWAVVSRGYLNMGSNQGQIRFVDPVDVTLPKQTPMLPIYSLDKNGVLMQSMADESTRLDANGMYDPAGGKGNPVYSPYIIASQLLQGNKTPGAAFSEINRNAIKRKPALNWLLNKRHYRAVKGAAIYTYPFNNAYNDIYTKAPWPSAFGQAYVLEALVYASENKLADSLSSSVESAANAYGVLVGEGGITTKDKAGLNFYEEVPNATHVLNAHLVSIPELARAARVIDSKKIERFSSEGIRTLREKLYLYDTGYWFRYDLNPKKHFLVQLNWLGGSESPLINEVLLENPQTGNAIRINVGEDGDFSGSSRLAGTDWSPIKSIEGQQVRGFANGYLRHKEPVKGGTRHNVYLSLDLPDIAFRDFFDVPVHLLKIKYKDVALGEFGIGLQSINEGSQLTFSPLRGGVWKTTGDQQWKEQTFYLRPQDLGWYKGPDYQIYEVKQLQRIANQTNDWFFYQYAKRHKYFLDKAQSHEPVIYDNKQYKTEAKPYGVSIVSSSPTYIGYDFNNALDDDPYSDYTAGIEGDEQYVIIEFNESENLSSIVFQWENAENFAENVIVRRVDDEGGLSDNLVFRIDSLTSDTSEVRLSGADKIKRFRVDFEGLQGQPRILLRRIRPILNNENKNIGTSFSDSDGYFLSPSDKRNPLSIFGVPVSNSIKELARSISAGATNDHEKVLRFMDYISTFQVGFASDASPDTTIKEQIGSCGTFTGTLLSLAAAAGLKGRYINLYNYPIESGHTVAEIYISGKWRIYDPTYNAFYVSIETGDKLPLGFEDLYMNDFNEKKVRPIIRTYRPGSELFTGVKIFNNAYPAGIIGPEKKMIFPLTLDAGKKDSISESDFGPKYQGAEFIGAASVNIHQIWSLKSLEPGSTYVFELAPKLLVGDLNEQKLFELQVIISGSQSTSEEKRVFDFGDGNIPSWEIEFKAQSPEMKIALTHPYLGPEYHYMPMRKYSLRRKN